MRASVAGSARVTRRLARLSILVVTLCLGAAGARAQDPPTITYTSANGLGHDIVTRLLLDPRGFLWVGGPSGLARFDGERFTVYGHAEGLDAGTAVNDLSLGPQGDLWIATNGAGIFRLDLASTDRAARFTQIHVGEGRPSNRVNTVLVTPDGHIWAGTDAGLFVGAARQPLQRLTLPLPPRYAQDQIQIRALAGKDAWVWIGGSAGVHRCNINGTGCRATASPGSVRFIDMSPDGRLRLGRAAGIEIWTLDAAGLTVEPPETIRGDWRPRRIGNASDGLLVLSDDQRLIWTDTRTERILFTSDGHNLNDIVEDAAGNLWVATYGGLVAIRRQGVTLFSAHRALRPPQLRRLNGTTASRRYVVTQDDSVHRIDGEVVTSARVVRPPGVSRSAWGNWSIHLDQANDVWMATAAGLYRFSSIRFSSDRPPEVAPSHRYTMADGLASNHLAEIFEDSRGDLWISHLPGRAETITVWRRRFARFEKIGPAEGLPAANQVGNFVEGADGDIWARMREGGIVRFRGNRATVFGAGSGLELLVSALLVDRHGNLWIGRGDNLLRASNPGADDLQVEPVLTRMGATVNSLEQDKAGNILVGTYTGLLSFDPATGSVRRFSSFEGLPSGSVDALIAEPDGTVLLTAGGTLARLDPAVPARGTSQPRCVVGALRIGARTLPWPETGLDRIGSLAISPSENQIEIELVGVSSRLGEPLEYRVPAARRVRCLDACAGAAREVCGTRSGSLYARSARLRRRRYVRVPVSPRRIQSVAALVSSVVVSRSRRSRNGAGRVPRTPGAARPSGANRTLAVPNRDGPSR